MTINVKVHKKQPNEKIIVQTVIDDDNPLVKLSNLLDWEKLIDCTCKCLNNTTKKGKPNTGRTLNLQAHLGCLLLQTLYNLSDRQTEEFVRKTPEAQVFCGLHLSSDGPDRVPHFTKIEEFRNRLDKQCFDEINQILLRSAEKSGFCNPANIDIDSTVQKANIHYPSDAHLLWDFCKYADRVANILNSNFKAGEKKNMR